MKLLSVTVLFALSISTQANADSFCWYDEGLIGTKAIGHVSLYKLLSPEALAKTGGCELAVYDDIPVTEAPPTVMACTEFINIRTMNFFGATGPDYDPRNNEYFRLLAFSTQDNWAQISLKNGDKKWVSHHEANTFNFPYFYDHPHNSAVLRAVYPSQGSVYAEPRLDKPDAYFNAFFRNVYPSWFHGDVLKDFFEHPLFEIMETNGIIDKKDMEQPALGPYEDFFHITYHVTDILKDAEGREWLEAGERLSVIPHSVPENVKYLAKQKDIELSEEDMLKLHKIADKEIKSGVVRTVYFPYREPGGTITMVMTDGPNCD